eukprot:TRINITY_DN64493_c0_g1_i1.p1 TRINITY_DN64493_c0_g1~~TRINITY_DN64493_c0_g1_i1.p1  ORF type:complete len:271 (-),score=23.53 TRINITY_DN64493_c0_g1_i1:186-911(-)
METPADSEFAKKLGPRTADLDDTDEVLPGPCTGTVAIFADLPRPLYQGCLFSAGNRSSSLPSMCGKERLKCVRWDTYTISLGNWTHFTKKLMAHESMNLVRTLEGAVDLIHRRPPSRVRPAPEFGTVAPVVSVQITGHYQEKGKPCMFSLHVRGSSAHYVYKRFSDFEELDDRIRCKFPDLPEIPPKSFFRKRFSPRFMYGRMLRLGKYISAAVLADPLLSTPALYDFLGAAHLVGSPRSP